MAVPSSAKKTGHLRDDGDARDRMDLHPLGVEGVLDVGAHDANVRADGREGDLVGVALAGGFGIGLSDGELAHDFEDQVAAFIAYVSSVHEILELRVELEPAVSVAVLLMADSVVLLASGGVHNRSGHGGALLLHDEARGMVDVSLQGGVTGGVHWRGSGWRRR